MICQSRSSQCDWYVWLQVEGDGPFRRCQASPGEHVQVPVRSVAWSQRRWWRLRGERVKAENGWQVVNSCRTKRITPRPWSLSCLVIYFSVHIPSRANSLISDIYAPSIKKVTGFGNESVQLWWITWSWRFISWIVQCLRALVWWRCLFCSLPGPEARPPPAVAPAPWTSAPLLQTALQGAREWVCGSHTIKNIGMVEMSLMDFSFFPNSTVWHWFLIGWILCLIQDCLLLT